jgi:hypothetical protein
MDIIKKILIALFIVTLLAIGIIWGYSHDKTYDNDENEIGNSSGNIYNGGLFCQQDDYIYFSNDNDEGSLYVMNSFCNQFKKVSNDKAVYINADDNYIYYIRANNTKETAKNNFLHFNNTGIYRINQNGSHLKCVSRMPGAYLTLAGNFLYYQGYDVNTGLLLYYNHIDCANEKILIKDTVIPAAVIDNNLYYNYNDVDHNINVLSLSSFTSKTQLNGSFAYPVFLGNFIYYINMKDHYKIYRINLDGSNPSKLVDKCCCTFNITNNGKFLYYQVDNGKNNCICRLNLETMEEETLSLGNYKQIHVTEDYVFFKDFDNTKTYIVSADGESKVSIFDPPNLNSSKQ